jgi:hypothetical protein
VAPLLSVGRTSLLCISTLTGEYNFYTRLFKMVCPDTKRPMFHRVQVRLSCDACIADSKAHECIHMLHLVPRWQSSERHRRLRTIMEDRPDLIQSELAGLAFDSMQSVFRPCDILTMFSQPSIQPCFKEDIFIVIDPAAGGPQSDYAFISFTRNRGRVQVYYPSSTQTIVVACFIHQVQCASEFTAHPGQHHIFTQIHEDIWCLECAQWSYACFGYTCTQQLFQFNIYIEEH